MSPHCTEGRQSVAKPRNKIAEKAFHGFLRSQKQIQDSLQLARNVIVVTVFLLIISLTEFSLVLNQKENYH